MVHEHTRLFSWKGRPRNHKRFLVRPAEQSLRTIAVGARFGEHRLGESSYVLGRRFSLGLVFPQSRKQGYWPLVPACLLRLACTQRRWTTLAPPGSQLSWPRDPDGEGCGEDLPTEGGAATCQAPGARVTVGTTCLMLRGRGSLCSPAGSQHDLDLGGWRDGGVPGALALLLPLRT